MGNTFVNTFVNLGSYLCPRPEEIDFVGHMRDPGELYTVATEYDNVVETGRAPKRSRRVPSTGQPKRTQLQTQLRL